MSSELETQGPLAVDELAKLYESIEASVAATTKTLQPLLEKCAEYPASPDLDFSSGLSLLLVRPQALLRAMHNLTILLAFRLLAMDVSSSSADENGDSSSTGAEAPIFSFSKEVPRDAAALEDLEPASAEATLGQDLSVVKEIMEKTRQLENKISYQVNKLVNLAATHEAKEAERQKKRAKEDADGSGEEDGSQVDEDDLLSFKPNPKALENKRAESTSERAPRRPESSHASRMPSRRQEDEEEEDEDERDVESDASGEKGPGGVYRPPRVAAMPYNEGKKGSGRRERKAPALLSEFATSLTSAPLLESTSGLSVNPVASGSQQHTNSVSAKRLAELSRMREFEEENMTRLVMTKREAKRREEDEAALMMGFGVGGEQRSRSRRQGGFEAELEGVLGDRGSGRDIWDAVGRNLGRRETALERSKKRKDVPGGGAGSGKRGKFEKAVKRRR